MPKQTPEIVVAFIAGSLVLNPETSYPETARMIAEAFNGFTLSIQGVKNIAERECPKLDPKWVKINPLPQVYKCQFRLPSGRRHLKEFRGERGYSGANAKHCPEHRGKKVSK